MDTRPVVLKISHRKHDKALSILIAIQKSRLIEMLSIRALLLAPFHLLERLGWKEGFVQGLCYILRRKTTVFHYYDMPRSYTVNFSITWKYIEKGVFEESGSLSYLRTIVKPSDLILDVGANIGEYTLFFSELVGKSGRVIAFEPDPINRELLQSNLQRNSIENALVEAWCISDRKGAETLFSRSFGSHESSITRGSNGKRALQSIQVDSISLDEYCQEKGISPKGVKVDVEGAEELVLKGMKETIKRWRPWVLLEFHGKSLALETAERLWGLIRKESSQIIFMDGEKLGYSPGDSVKWELPPPKSHFRILLIF
jgi:FkbM family methyltransferase